MEMFIKSEVAFLAKERIKKCRCPKWNGRGQFFFSKYHKILNIKYLHIFIKTLDILSCSTSHERCLQLPSRPAIDHRLPLI